MNKDVTVLDKNRVVIRTNSVWYMVTIQYLRDQIRFSKNSIFEKAHELAKKEYGNKYDS